MVTDERENASPSDHEVLTTFFVSNRLHWQLVIPPEFDRPIPVRKAKIVAKKRIGSLRLFLDMSLDVIFEIVSYLEPRDLLTLSRLSNEFRSLFMSRSSLAIWRRVLGQVPRLPECPTDLSEPQYASLLYDKFCMACSTVRGVIKTDFSLRIRMCTKCMKRNTICAREIMPQYEVGDILVSLLPFTTIDYHNSVEVWPFEDDINHFVPDFEGLLEKFSNIDEHMDDEYLQGLISSQRALVDKMNEEGIALAIWSEETQDLQFEEAETRRLSRRDHLLQEIDLLGWDRDFFPQEGDDEYKAWEKYLNQPKDFSRRGWNIIRPKMEALYEQTKVTRQRERLWCYLVMHYLDIRGTLSDSKKSWAPTLGDIENHGYLNSFVDEKYSDWQQQEVADIIHDVLIDNDHFIAQVKHDILKMLDPIAGSGPEALDEARLLLTCGYWTCRMESVPIPFTDAIQHMAGVHDTGWTEHQFSIKRQVYSAASDVLEALGLAAECTNTELAALGKFVCGCDHHLFRGLLTFESLVDHVHREQEWYRQTWEKVPDSRRNDAAEYLFNSHDLDGLRNLLRRATAEDAQEEDEDLESSDVPPGHICSICYQLTHRISRIKDETAEYHMRVKHQVDGSDEHLGPDTEIVMRFNPAYR